MCEAHNALLTAAEEYLYPAEMVVLRGDGAEMAEWTAKLNQQYVPRRMVLAISSDAGKLPGMLANYVVPETGVLAYVCREGCCLAPVTSLAELQGKVAG